MPCIADWCTVQKYGNDPAWVNVCENVIPEPAPESHLPSGVHTPEQVPEVVEWKPLTQTHCTVSPTRIVVVLEPLCGSTNDMEPPGPT
jgi:hypothetical protein